MRSGSRHDGHEGFLGDLFLNLAAVVIFAIAVVAVERPVPARGTDVKRAGIVVFALCGDAIRLEDGPTINADVLLGSDFARGAVEASEATPVLRVGAGSDTAVFLLSAHLARLGRTELVFTDGGCRAAGSDRP